MLGGKSTGLVLDARPNFVVPTSLEDRSRYGNDGTFTNITPQLIKSGLYAFKCTDATAGNNKIVIPHSDSVDITSPFAMELWVYEVTKAAFQTVMFKGLGNDAYLFQYDGSGDKLRFFIKYGGTSKTADSDVTFPSEAWTHLIGVFNGSNAIFYINGQAQADQPASLAPGSSSDELRIGQSQNSLSVLPRIYNYAVPAHAVYSRYQATRSLFGV